MPGSVSTKASLAAEGSGGCRSPGAMLVALGGREAGRGRNRCDGEEEAGATFFFLSLPLLAPGAR